MNKSNNLKTKIFLDSGDPVETREALELIGWLDGQTTNPSLVAKNPELKAKIESGEKLSSEEVNDFYKEVVQDISQMIPNGSVSVEVYADLETPKEEMLEQAQEMNAWIPNAHIKLPITKAGLETADSFTKAGGRVNMTLCFNQDQGAAVHAATASASKGGVFLSPFIGRLDDRGINGMSLIKNIKKMFDYSNSHVEVLAASARSYEHFKYCLALGVDIVTVPLRILKEWKENNLEVPGVDYIYDKGEMKDLEYEELDLNMNWEKFDIQHELTDQGIEKFVKDWNSLIVK